MNAQITNTPLSVSHQAHRRTIRRYFAGRGSPHDASAMREHTAACDTCRVFYERHLLLARLDPAALPAEERIARALGFKARAHTGWLTRLNAALLIPVAAGAIIAVSFHARHGERTTAADFVAPTPRGVTSAAAAFWAYRIDPAAPPRLVGSSIATRDELAFAYANPGRLPYLMIFGRDEHRHVYWFHPAWKDGQPAPAAIPASAGPGPHELPEAIGHPYGGRTLDLFAVFAPGPVGVTAIEEIARNAADAKEMSAQLAARSLIVNHRVLEVRR